MADLKGFIEVTEYESGLRVLCPVSKILSVVCDKDGGVFIELDVDGKLDSSGVLVRESYDDIKSKLRGDESN